MIRENDRELLLDTLQRLMGVQAIELRPALSEAADAIHAATGAEKVDVFLHDDRSQSLVALGVSGTALGAKQRALGLDHLPVANGGRAVRVFQSGADFTTGHAETDPEELRGVVDALHVRSNVVLPVEVAGVRRGVLGICSTEPDAFPDFILGFARAAARWVGVIAHRAEIIERLAAEASERGRRAAAEELVTVVAHDIRNYLYPVQTRLSLLKQRASREGLDPYRQDAEAAERSLARLGRLVSDLLDVARIEQGLFAIEAVPVDLVSLLRELAAAMETPGVPVTVGGAPEVVLVADPVKLRQAFENLLSNACAHSPPGSAVGVDISAAVAEKATWAAVQITDQGPGMDPDLASRVFTRFARGPNSKGLGLGLYLAREIVVAHGGTVELSTRAGRGTTFTVRLPVQPH